MSLLLQALQKAAKTREAAGTDVPSVDSTASGTADGSMLELEPGDFELPTARASTSSREADNARSARRSPTAAGTASTLSQGSPAPRAPSAAGAIGAEPTPQQAAAVVAAGRGAARATPVAGRGSEAAEWVREHPVHLFAGVAVLFLLGYGSYVWLEVTHPGMLRNGLASFGSKPPPPISPLASTPAASPSAIEPPAPPPALAAAAGGPVMPAPESNTLPPPPAPDAPTRADPAPTPTLAPTADAVRLAADATSRGRGDAARPSLASEAAEPRMSSDVRATTAPKRTVTPPAATPDTRAPASATRRASAGSSASRRAAPATPAPAPIAAADSGAADPRSVDVRRTDAASNLAALLEEGWRAAQQGDNAKARSAYERARALDARNTDAMLGLGAVAWQEGRTEQASDWYNRVLALDPQNAAAQAAIIGMVGRVDPIESESRLKQLIAREPSGWLYQTLGNLHAEQGQWARAQQAWFQAAQLEPANADYAFNVAVGLDRIGQKKPAAGWYRRALELARAGNGAAFDRDQASARLARLEAATPDAR
jgi:Flp pilus assembly protein TadD